MTARRLAYLLIFQVLLLCVGGGILLRHALQDDLGIVQAPVVFVLTHDVHLTISDSEQTPLARLYTLVGQQLTALSPDIPVGIIRASDEPLYLIPDTSDTASLLTALPLFPQLARDNELTIFTPTTALIQKIVAHDAQLIFLTDSNLLPWQSTRTSELGTLARTYSIIVVDFNANSPLATQSNFPVIAPNQLTDYLVDHTYGARVSISTERKRLFLVLLGI